MRELRLIAAAVLLVPALSAGPALAAAGPARTAGTAGTADVVVAPAPPAPEPTVLQGTAAIVRWRNNDDTHVVRVVVVRVAGTVAPASPSDGAPVFDGAPDPDGALQVVLDTVTIGTTYTYGYWSYDAAGNASAETTHSIVATAVPELVAPALAAAGPATAIPLRWDNAVSPAGTQYDVKVAVRDPVTGVVPDWTIWQLGTTLTHAVFPGKAGTTYRFEVLSQDPYGNDTRHSTATVVEPYDTTAGVASRGWTTVSSPRRWGGTVAVARTPGAVITWKATGSQVSVIADRCPGCGKAVLRIDGTVRLVVDTHAPALAVRQVVGTVGHLSQARHSISVQVVGTTGHPVVQLDAIAVLD